MVVPISVDIMTEAFKVDSKESLAEYHRYINELWEKHKHITFGYTLGRTRTGKQQAALEVYCRLVAEALNDAGYDLKIILEKDPQANIPWSQHTVKQLLWKPIMLAMLNKSSTAECDRMEYSQVYDVLNQNLVDKRGICVQWPVKGEGK